jgi:hypothetical protein
VSVAFRKVLSDDQFLVLQDLGPWDFHQTITNGAEEVVSSVATELGDRRLFYFDSENQLDEIIVVQGGFHGFAHDEHAATDIRGRMGAANG